MPIPLVSLIRYSPFDSVPVLSDLYYQMLIIMLMVPLQMFCHIRRTGGFHNLQLPSFSELVYIYPFFITKKIWKKNINPSQYFVSIFFDPSGWNKAGYWAPLKFPSKVNPNETLTPTLSDAKIAHLRDLKKDEESTLQIKTEKMDYIEEMWSEKVNEENGKSFAGKWRKRNGFSRKIGGKGEFF